MLGISERRTPVPLLCNNAYTKGKCDRQTDTHGTAHKVFFAHAREWGTPKNGSSRKGIWGYGLDPSHSGQVPVVGSCKHGNEPLGFIKYGKYKWATITFSRWTLLHVVSYSDTL